jgi:hypothetical protein
MSNITAQMPAVSIGYEYSTYILGTMFVMSEILPLLKKKPNGLLHALLCLIQGSKCVLDNVEEKITDNLAAAADSKKTAVPPV